MEFRQKALAKLRSPEELDLPVRLARPQGWLVLSVAVVVLAAAAVWAVAGTVSSKLSAPGVLTHGQGSYVLQSPLAGQVVAVRATEGDTLAAGAPVLDLRTAQGVRPVRTVAAGRVVTLPAGIGAVIATGADVATLERVRQASDPLVAMLYVSPSRAASIPAGAPVELTVASVPGRYGRLRGKVAAVGGLPQTRGQLTAFLGDTQLADAFSAKGAPVAVLVRLERGRSPSGYAWSEPPGPPRAPASLTGVSGSVRLSAQRPLDWPLP
ncbi:HlyD family efflux transporter periplasmic adaptor subunit [Streptomyces sp. HPF1205]|uniref:HlyD family efflux transporter periplasmic adaptor subunit n=1 Tax=Streptomyces sp. HPF1205 TaxID=2873262 RepID=UPI001CED8F84|nr:HlyD family efflux transporter periplasmic adaptor subunit [Streptomyces sp. HPF1205]